MYLIYYSDSENEICIEIKFHIIIIEKLYGWEKFVLRDLLHFPVHEKYEQQTKLFYLFTVLFFTKTT